MKRLSTEDIIKGVARGRMVFNNIITEAYMAQTEMKGMPEKERRISETEVEAWKLEKFAEREFLAKLDNLISELELKVSPRNRLLASMGRIFRNYR